MAGHGNTLPKDPSERRRRNAPPEVTVLQADGRVRGPVLPSDVLPGGEAWHPQTRKLWDALRRDPILATETPVGWQFLLDTMLMHHTMWAKGRWEFASEVRLRLAKYGATPEDRQRLKVRVTPGTARTPVEPTGPATETSAAARRRGMHIAG